MWHGSFTKCRRPQRPVVARGLVSALLAAAVLGTQPARAGVAPEATHCRTLPFVLGALADACLLDVDPFTNYGSLPDL